MIDNSVQLELKMMNDLMDKTGFWRRNGGNGNT